VDIWVAGLDEVTSVDSDFGRRWLSEDERQRAARFAFEADRRAFAARRGLLRLVLSSYAGMSPAAVRISYGACGKPFVATGPSFNAASSGGVIVVAVTERLELGVDVERIRATPDLDGLVALVCAPGEEDWVRGGDADTASERFLRLWARKEAVLKAAGLGLSESLTKMHVGIPPNGDGAGITVPDSPARRWSVTDVDLESRGAFVGAVAVEGSTPPVRCTHDASILLAAV
jgi:4'-phosphopantetheinyl transferase